MKQAWGSIFIFVSCWRCRPCVASGFSDWNARLCCWALFLHQKCQVTKAVYFLELAQHRVSGPRHFWETARCSASCWGSWSMAPPSESTTRWSDPGWMTRSSVSGCPSTSSGSQQRWLGNNRMWCSMSLPGVEVRCEPVLGDVHGVGAVHDQRLHHRDQHVLHQGGQQPGGTTQKLEYSS